MKRIIICLLLLGAVAGKGMAQAECCMANGTFLTELYNNPNPYPQSPPGWTFVDEGDGLNNQTTLLDCDLNTTQNGGIDIRNGSVNFNSLRNGREVRLTRSLPSALSNTSWTADFKLTINTVVQNQLATNSPAVFPLVFNNDGGPITNGCNTVPLNTGCPSFTTSGNNAIAVLLLATQPPPTASCNNSNPSNAWVFRGFAKWGTTTYNSTNDIPLTANTVYYIRLQRVSAGFVRLSVFNDPGYCNHLANSPQCFPISPNITGLSFLQHENSTPGVWRRIFNGSLSGLKIDNNSSCGYATATAGPDILTCTGQASNVTIGSAANPTGTGYTYSWTPATNIVGPTNGPTAIVNNISGGQYVLNYTSGGCPFSDAVFIRPPLLISAGPDVMNCLPLLQSSLIGSTNNPLSPPVTYSWSSNNPNITLGIGGNGTGGASGIGSAVITLTATDQFGCTVSDQLNYTGLQVDAGPDRTYCFFSNNSGVMIGGNTPELPGYTYTWTALNAVPNAGIICANCPRTLVRPNVNANFTFNYMLTVTSPWGSQCNDIVRVTVLYKQPNTAVSLPASYTVNCSNPGATVLTPTITTASPPIVNHDWKSLTYPSVNNLSSTTVAAPSFTNCNNGSNPATFFITVTDNFGCQASAQTSVSYVNGPPTSGGGSGGGNRTAVPLSGDITKTGPSPSAINKRPQVFPIPNKGQFTIQAPAGKRLLKAIVRNSEGRVVKWYDRINGPQLLVHLRSGSSGVYWAEIWLEGETQSVVQKVLVGQ